MWYRHTALILLLLSSSSLCRAAVYRCTAVDGSTTYTDSPCEVGTKSITLQQTGPATMRASTVPGAPVAPAANSLEAALASILAQCISFEYHNWYATHSPKPSAEEGHRKLEEINRHCQTTLPPQNQRLAGTSTPSLPTVQAPTLPKAALAQQAAQRAAVNPSPAAGPRNGPLIISRSRQPEEARRWEQSFQCQTSEYQAWLSHVGHPPGDLESRSAQSRAEQLCAQRFNVPVGVAVMITP